MTVQPLRQSVLDLEWVRQRVSAKEAGTVVNPTADTVTMAFKVSGDPSVGDFKTAVWETDANTNPDTYYARCLVGPGGTIALATGTYRIWVKIADSPETPIKRSEQTLVIF